MYVILSVWSVNIKAVLLFQGEFARMSVKILWKNDSACDAFVPVPPVVQTAGNVTVQVAHSDPALLDFEITKTIEIKVTCSISK